MSEMPRRPWQEFKVGKLPAKGYARSCTEFAEVYHTAHVPDAIRILDDDLIRQSLVWDESKLRNTRTTVSWVSPNDWYYGYIYGNIRFTFPFESITRNRKFYWVESVKSYSPTALRFLISDSDCSELDVLPYEPGLRDGPLWRSSGGNWYYNNYFTLEFMVDSDLSLEIADGISLVKHHPNICRKLKKGCKDRGKAGEKVGRRFLATVLGRDSRKWANLFRSDCLADLGIAVASDVHTTLQFLYMRLSKNLKDGAVRYTDEEVSAMVRAALLLYGDRQYDTARTIVELIGNSKQFRSAMDEIVTSYLDEAYVFPK